MQKSSWWIWIWNGYPPVELPVPSDDSRQEILVSAGGLPVDLVVGAHDAGHVPVHHAALERGLERVVQVLLRHLTNPHHRAERSEC